jgi:hypothetical protein
MAGFSGVPVEGLDVFEDVSDPPSGKGYFPLGDPVKHESVVRVGAVGDGKGSKPAHAFPRGAT